MTPPATRRRSGVSVLQFFSFSGLVAAATHLRPAHAGLRFRFGRRGDPSPAIRPPVQVSSLRLIRPAPSLRFQVSGFRHPRKASGFTLIELLVVIAIIAILAGLGFAGISGALKSAKKAETRAMANQIKLALSSYYAEYGVYPAVTTANANFANAMTGATNVPTIPNRRGIRFLEVPPKFTNSDGIVTPEGLYKARTDRRVFRIKTDTNYDGRINLGFTNMAGSVAVWVADPDSANRQIGTW